MADIILCHVHLVRVFLYGEKNVKRGGGAMKEKGENVK
jgi:hypothetical protein